MLFSFDLTSRATLLYHSPSGRHVLSSQLPPHAHAGLLGGRLLRAGGVGPDVGGPLAPLAAAHGQPGGLEDGVAGGADGAELAEDGEAHGAHEPHVDQLAVTEAGGPEND